MIEYMDINRPITLLIYCLCLNVQAATLVISTVPKLPVFIKIQHHLEYAYSLMGYEVEFVPMSLGRASKMADEGSLDGVSVRVPAIEKITQNLIRIPVMLLSGDLSLYCIPDVPCDETVLNDDKIMVGGLSNVPVMQNFMSDKNASLYLVHDAPQLKALFEKKRLDYILSIEIDGLGNFQELAAGTNHIKLLALEVFHYVNKRHVELVPHITQSLLQSQIELGQIYP